MSAGDLINRPVIAKTAQGDLYDRGRVVSYSSAPTFQIERPDGTRFSWHAHMTELDPDEEQVDTLTDALLSETELGFEMTKAQVSKIARRLFAKGVRVGGDSDD